MKYFSPNYWLKLWVLSAPLFNSKNEGIYAKSIDNKNIKDWASNNTNLQLIENQAANLSNNQTIQFQNHENIPSSPNLETDDFYEKFLKTQGWSNNPEMAPKKLIEIQEEHHVFLEKKHKRAIFNRKTKNEKNDKNLITTTIVPSAQFIFSWDSIHFSRRRNELVSSNYFFNNRQHDPDWREINIGCLGLLQISEIILRGWGINTLTSSQRSQDGILLQRSFINFINNNAVNIHAPDVLFMMLNNFLRESFQENSSVNINNMDVNFLNNRFALVRNYFNLPDSANNAEETNMFISARNLNRIQERINNIFLNDFGFDFHWFVTNSFNNELPFLFYGNIINFPSSAINNILPFRRNQYNDVNYNSYFLINSATSFSTDLRENFFRVYDPCSCMSFYVSMHDFLNFIIASNDFHFAHGVFDPSFQTANYQEDNFIARIESEIEHLSSFNARRQSFIEDATNELNNNLMENHLLSNLDCNNLLSKIQYRKNRSIAVNKRNNDTCYDQFLEFNTYLLKNKPKEQLKNIFVFLENEYNIHNKNIIESGDKILWTNQNIYFMKKNKTFFHKINNFSSEIINIVFYKNSILYLQTFDNDFYAVNLSLNWYPSIKIISNKKNTKWHDLIKILEIFDKEKTISKLPLFLITEMNFDKKYNNYWIKLIQGEIYQVNLYKQSILKLDCSTTKEMDKEINFFYQKNKSDFEIKNKNTKIFDFNLGNINPLDYQKIEFLGDKFETSSFWGLTVHIDTGKNISYFNGYNLSDLIINEMLTNDVEIENHSNLILLPLQTKEIGWATVTVKQSFGLSFHWNNNYYLQVFIYQQSSKNNWAWNYADNIINIGKGIKLYNDNNTFKKKEKNAIYFKFDKKENAEQIITSKDWDDNYSNDYHSQNNVIIEQNLGNINPLDYQKIEFLGSIDNFNQSRISWGNEKYFAENFLNNFYNKDIWDVITNQKFDENNNYWDPKTCKLMLQNEKVEKTWHSELTWKMCLGLSFYWENKNYHLQVLIRQYAHSNTMRIWSQGGTLFTGIGKGIRLYNYDDSLEKKIPNPNDIKKREIFEEKNITKWNDDFTNSINYEQHLPINTKTNFVTSNITSL